jgi:CRISPR-associated endonuclease Csn1
MKYKLGFDFGTNSLGWAIIELNNKNQPISLINLGSYIYTDGRVPKNRASLCKERTEKRGIRNTLDKRLRRKQDLFNLLIEYNLFPQTQNEQEKLKSLNPYELRNKAVLEKINPYELGRVLYHLCQRRGFKSNRKSDKSEMKTLQPLINKAQELLKKQDLTLGQFLYKRIKNNGKGGDRYNKNQKSARIKPDTDLYFLRQNYEDEFNKIKEVQSQYHNLNEKQWNKIHNAIFYQRDLKPQDCGKCTFLYTEGEKRILKAYPSFQKFRILCDINNLAYGEKGKKKKPLTQEQRNKLFEILQNQKEIKFSAINKKIGIDKDLVFNLETPKRLKLKGNSTAKLLSKKEYFGEKWFQFSTVKQDDIIKLLFEEEDEEKIANKAINDWKLTNEQAKNLASDISSEHKDLEKGYGEICQKLILIMLPYLKKGNLYNIALEKAGKDIGKNLHHSDFRTGEIFDELPYYGQVMPESVLNAKNGSEEEEKYGRINNPTVHIGLNRLRKITNEIIKQYGHPKFVNIEVARDLGLGQKGLNQLNSDQAEATKNNKRICKELDKLNITKNRENIQKYKLWEELPTNAHGNKVCPFSGKTIGINQLFNSNIEIEHILPHSKTLDDSMNNKTLSYRETNAYKGERSPYEAFNHPSSIYNYQDILDRVFDDSNDKNFKRKRWRFEENAMERFSKKNDFLARAINDTRYLSKIARKYLSFVCNPDNITTVKGQLTAKIRHHWGLNSILSEDGKKNRDDHRHHAIDAVVIGLINRSVVKSLSHKYDTIENNKEKLQEPWENFRNDVKNIINKTIVHHRSNHKIQGVLHEEGNYHILKKPKDQFNLTIRKKITELNEKEVSQIVNDKIREDLFNEIIFIDKEYTKKEKADLIKNILSNYSQKHNIKNIKLYKSNASIQKIEHKSKNGKTHYKGIIPGKNHHISFWKLAKNTSIKKMEDFCTKLGVPLWISKDGKYCAICINYFLINKYKDKKGNIDYNNLKPCPSAKLIMRLYKKDSIYFKDNNLLLLGQISKLNIMGNRIFAYINTNANQKRKEYSLSFSKFEEKQVRKVYITPLGKILDNNRWYKKE